MKHYPAHESLQEFANRLGLSITKAYPRWHDRTYMPIQKDHQYHGPGLGLLHSDVRDLHKATYQ